MGTDFQRQAKCLNNAAVSCSSRYILHDVGDWLTSQVMDGLDDAQAVLEGSCATVAEAVLIASRAERLTIRTGQDKVDTSQRYDAGRVN